MQSGGGRSQTERGHLAARFAPLLLALPLFTIYLFGLHPGVDAGDSAELQFSAPLLGICHPPGYAIEVTLGRLWILLPFSGSIAWRMNLLMAVMGVAGCLALYGSLRRITGQVIPGLAGALLLGLSGVFWSHALVAEAYVFYGALLLIGLYATVRFLDAGRPAWLFAASLLVGAAVWDRPSELFVLPAFGILGVILRDRIRIERKHAAVALGLFILPFVFSVGCYLARNDPGRLAIRDDAERDEILVDVSREISRGYGAHPTPLGKVGKAASYCLGLNWTTNPSFRLSGAGRSLGQYAVMLSGARAFAGRPKVDWMETGAAGLDEAGRAQPGPAGADPDAPRPDRAEAAGASIGLAGVFLAAFAVARRTLFRPWVLFGIALFGGNLLFVLWHHSWDNMTFTVPGVAGLALLGGLGSARNDGRGGELSARVRAAVAGAAVLFLLLGNFAAVSRRGEAERSAVAFSREVAGAPWPGNGVILCSYWPAMTLRYDLYIEAARRDVRVLCAVPADYMKLIRRYAGEGRPVFLLAAEVTGARREALAQATDPALARLGFLLANPAVEGEAR